jgi:hypothetical protein
MRARRASSSLTGIGLGRKCRCFFLGATEGLQRRSKNNSRTLLTKVYRPYTDGYSMKRTKVSTVVIPLKMPPELQTNIRKVAAEHGLSDQDIMRLAIKRGLPVIEKMFASSTKVAA